ncbi:asparagine synthase-related protein [Halobium palmae]|uniref:Asparagine synthase-related protein n=1 Tax=Halobium palmae TaxID=1776492 RepID=A0ABD5RXJ7_9EURY
MGGILGVVGDSADGIDAMEGDLLWTGEETVATYSDADVTVRNVHHPGTEREPASTESGVSVWVWGDVWGFDGDGYRSRLDEGSTVAEFCARRFEAHGVDFAAGLNGTFAAVVYDRDEGEVHLLTDRLGTHPIYVARPDADTLVFSTRIQSLPSHPSVAAEFVPEYAVEYLTYAAVGGVKTPLVGVEELHPSSITTVDLDTGAVESRRYWRPRLDPLDRPFSYFVEEFVERFRAALSDRLHPDKTYGLLVSGGSDSRAVLAGIGSEYDVRTYHTSGWQSRESRAAERVALAADREFDLLHRDVDSYGRMLRSTPRTMGFQGYFSQAHVSEFGRRLRDEVDVLISGHGADTLFRDHAFPRPTVRLGSLGSFELPIIERTTTVDDHVARRARELPGYLDFPSRPDAVLRRNIDAGDGVTHHGVTYRSVDELVFFDDWYPFSNKADFFYHALNGIAPHWSPFFDNRLVDLALRLPARYRVRRNVVNAATAALDRHLSAIPHGTTGVPLDRSFPVDYLWYHVNDLRRELFSSDRPPKPYLSHGPWDDKNELIRSHDFVGETLRNRADVLESLPFLDREGARECYEDHLRGADSGLELFVLASFLEMPVTERIAAGDP